jgi:hypothetical protein
MYRRMLFVGLGGSGGKTLRVLKRDLKEWLKDHEWEGNFPTGWQFVHIDTPPTPDGEIAGGGSLETNEYLGLIGSGVQFSQVATRLGNLPGSDRELIGWRVDPAALQVPITMGAGQFRAIGRSIAMCYAQPIKERLQQSIALLNNPATVAQLGSVYSHVEKKSSQDNSVPPIVVIVSSLAGGTGAGLLVDVCDTMRALQPEWGGNSIALLYTPEVFLGLGDGAVGGVQPNSLAAISEVLNGYWWHGGTENTQVPTKSLAALRAAGIAREIVQSGPFCPFLIGSTGTGGVQFTSDRQLFETVGAALVSWATDVEVQQNFVAHSIGNWAASATANQINLDVLVNHGLTSEPGLPAFSALGFSRVSLGVKYLRRYSAKRLAKDGALHLANAHLASAEAQSIIQSRKIVDPDQVCDEIAERYVSWFMSSAKLDEKGPEKNEIQSQITPVQWWSVFDRAVSRAMELSSRNGSASASDWLEGIIPAVEAATSAFDAEMQPLVQENINEWLKTQPDHVLSVVEEAISRFGLKVAASILMKVINIISHPTEGVIAELLGDSEMNSYLQFANSSSWQGQLRVHLDESSKSKIASDHPAISESIKDAMKYSTCIARAGICERTADLLSDFAAGFLKPLARALADQAGILDAEMASISDWPAWGDGLPPQDLRPPKSEWTLIEVEEFAKTFSDKLSESFSGQAGWDRLAFDDHRREARNEVVSGSFIRHLMETSPQIAENLRELLLLKQVQKWAPDYRVSKKPEPRTEAVFAVRALPEHLTDRADAWMMQQGTPFHLLFSSNLRSYTEQQPGEPNMASPAEYTRRQVRFKEKLRAAISSAEPLVGIDQGMIGDLHPRMVSGVSMKIKRDVSQLPFLSHALDAEVRTILEDTCYGGGRQALIDKIIVGSTKLPHIDIVSQLDSPVSPLVIKSLMQPISDSWTQAQSKEVAQRGFWTYRRARTLKEFIPVPQEHLRAMTRGWFTAKLLNLVFDSEIGTVSIVHEVGTRSQRVVKFPEQLLSASNSPKDQLPMVLEALPLAYAAVGTAGNLDSLLPYIALRDLGMERPGALQGVYSYSMCNPVLANWIETGEIPNSQQIPGYKGVRPDIVGSTKSERADNLGTFLGTQIKEYEKMYDDYLHRVSGNNSLLSRAPFWPELKEDIVVSLLELQRAALSMKEGEGTDF